MTKWVRSVVPIVGPADTQDAALLEVAYYAEGVLFPGGKAINDDIVRTMLSNPTIFSVYPACPNAFHNENVKPNQSAGGGWKTDTAITEDWVLRYPKCRGPLARECLTLPAGTKCNNCGWNSFKSLETCEGTLAHEHGHTIDEHYKKFIGNAEARKKVQDQCTATFGERGGKGEREGPAWSASQFLMNPNPEKKNNKGRKVSAVIRCRVWRSWPCIRMGRLGVRHVGN